MTSKELYGMVKPQNTKTDRLKRVIILCCPCRAMVFVYKILIQCNF